MTAIHHQEGQGMRQQPWREPMAHRVVKAATAVTAGGSLLVLSGLTLTATVIGLTLATPILVIFSPVLVPAVIALFVLASGFLSAGGFGVAAATVLSWMYRYVVSGEHGTGEESFDHMTRKLGSKGEEHHDEVGKGHHATGGVHMTTGARAGLYRG
ncbi:hypothetical protein SSX86_018164 [Deinandra increscens subsp. villosa]|uniref:Oleosin n=1 Tax=Deinandra increscens subsp. villosa TaxID=3103831 RepID=A0AAP0CXC3_9ASTR